MKTPATDVLDGLGIEYEIVTFRAKEYSAEEAARELGVPLGHVFKTLLVSFEGEAARPAGFEHGSKHGLFVVPGDRELDPRAAAAAAGVKRAALAPPSDLQRMTGYVKGGCSPLGTRRPLPVWIDRSALELPRVTLSAGRRGVQIRLAPADLIRACRAMTASLCR